MHFMLLTKNIYLYYYIIIINNIFLFSSYQYGTYNDILHINVVMSYVESNQNNLPKISSINLNVI